MKTILRASVQQLDATAAVSFDPDFWLRQKKVQHPSLGTVQRWSHSSGSIRVDRYRDMSGNYLALVVDGEGGTRVLSRHRQLQPAQRAGERFLRRMRKLVKQRLEVQQLRGTKR